MKSKSLQVIAAIINWSVEGYTGIKATQAQLAQHFDMCENTARATMHSLNGTIVDIEKASRKEGYIYHFKIKHHEISSTNKRIKRFRNNGKWQHKEDNAKST